jgi:glycine/D-amino acid oxidase-like deaminating enzyme
MTGADAVARIVTHTCDGLPFVGPIPGDPRRVACTGMLGVGPALAVACADQVAEGLLFGARGSALLAPGRMAG